MPRAPRIELAGGIHHVISRGENGRVFYGDEDRRLFLRELYPAVLRERWSCLAYCLMGSHYHLVLETPEPNLGAGMRRFLSRFAQRSNERIGRAGHRFRERYRSVLVETDEHFACLLRYVALNPVNAGLCREPSQWPWSSHARMLAGHDTPLTAVRRVETLLGCWGGPPGTRYGALLAEQGRFGSWEDAVSPYPPRPTIAELVASMPADVAMNEARHRYGYRVAEIATAFRTSPATVSRRTKR